jgi:hypothetical protein
LMEYENDKGGMH